MHSVHGPVEARGKSNGIQVAGISNQTEAQVKNKCAQLLLPLLAANAKIACFVDLEYVPDDFLLEPGCPFRVVLWTWHVDWTTFSRNWMLFESRPVDLECSPDGFPLGNGCS